MAGEKLDRVFALFGKILGPQCPECSDILGEGWNCKTCIASLSELTSEERGRLEKFDLSEVYGIKKHELKKCDDDVKKEVIE